MIVPDVNLLIYAVHRESPHHETARAWLDAVLNGDEPVGFAWTVLMGFVRVITNARVMSGRPLTVEQALAVVDVWLTRPMASTVEPGTGHWAIFRQLLIEARRGANLTTDAHLAALCIERGATLVSADSDFQRFRGLRYENPLLGAR